MRHATVSRIAALLLAAGLPLTARASSIAETLTEVMMESQGLQAITIGSIFGGDSASPIAFTSLVDVDARTFSYSAVPGSTYLGESVVWSTSGAYDPSTELYEWSTTCLVGLVDLSGVGAGGPFVGDDPPFEMELLNPPPGPLPKVVSTFSDVDYMRVGGKLLSKGTITVRLENGLLLSTSKHTDELITEGPDKGNFRWDTGVVSPFLLGFTYTISSAGFSPLPDGGPGSFTTTITAVPEPSSWMMTLFGSLGTLGLLIRRRPR